MMHEKLVYNKVSIKNGEIGYVKIGQGRPLVMVNRYAATLYNWDQKLIATLAENFTVYLLDSRLVGYSHSQNSEDIDGYVTDIKQAIQALAIDKPIVAGWSFGGIAVQHLYRAYTDNISGLVMLSSFPDPRAASMEFIELSMGNGELSDENKVKLYHLMLSELPKPGVPNWLKQNTLQITDYHYRYTNIAKELHNKFVLTSNPSTDEDLAKISVPCLILNAKNDLSFPAAGRDKFINNIKTCKSIIYPSGGHLLIHHHGAEIALDITNYFI